MGVAQPILVTGKDGWHGIVHSWWGGSPGGGEDSQEITIRVDTGETIVVSDAVLTGRPDGTYYVPLSLDELRRARSEPSDAAPIVIPVIHEELEVGKRTVDTGIGVRIHKSAREEEQTVDLPLIHEEVNVERVRVDRAVDAPVPVRHVGDTIIVPVIEEVLVVQKQLRLVEELHIHKTRVETRQPQKVVLRKEEATVERLNGSRENPEESDGGPDDFRPV
jgi:uncharacterized protein (TIGR02271 family)